MKCGSSSGSGVGFTPFDRAEPRWTTRRVPPAHACAQRAIAPLLAARRASWPRWSPFNSEGATSTAGRGRGRGDLTATAHLPRVSTWKENQTQPAAAPTECLSAFFFFLFLLLLFGGPLAQTALSPTALTPPPIFLIDTQNWTFRPDAQRASSNRQGNGA